MMPRPSALARRRGSGNQVTDVADCGEGDEGIRRENCRQIGVASDGELTIRRSCPTVCAPSGRRRRPGEAMPECQGIRWQGVRCHHENSIRDPAASILDQQRSLRCLSARSPQCRRLARRLSHTSGTGEGRRRRHVRVAAGRTARPRRRVGLGKSTIALASDAPDPAPGQDRRRHRLPGRRRPAQGSTKRRCAACGWPRSRSSPRAR